MRCFLKFAMILTIAILSACNKAYMGDHSGIYIGDYKYYNPISNKFFSCKNINALYLKPDSTFSYRKGRWIWGNGTWHDNGNNLILSFSVWADSIPPEDVLTYITPGRWYERMDIRLTKKGTDKLMLNMSILKKKKFKDSIQKRELIRSREL